MFEKNCFYCCIFPAFKMRGRNFFSIFGRMGTPLLPLSNLRSFNKIVNWSEINDKSLMTTINYIFNIQIKTKFIKKFKLLLKLDNQTNLKLLPKFRVKYFIHTRRIKWRLFLLIFLTRWRLLLRRCGARDKFESEVTAFKREWHLFLSRPLWQEANIAHFHQSQWF